MLKSSSAASRICVRFQRTIGVTLHKITSGATNSAPTASPSHQVSQTEP